MLHEAFASVWVHPDFGSFARVFVHGAQVGRDPLVVHRFHLEACVWVAGLRVVLHPHGPNAAAIYSRSAVGTGADCRAP